MKKIQITIVITGLVEDHIDVENLYIPTGDYTEHIRLCEAGEVLDNFHINGYAEKCDIQLDEVSS